MKHLSLKILCLVIAFPASLFLTAQTVEAEFHYPNNSSHNALIFLENGNLIQAVAKDETCLLTEWTTNLEEVKTDVYPVGQYGHFISLTQVAEDTLLTFGLDGKLILISMSDQYGTRIGDLFPSLISNDFHMVNPEIRHIKDTLAVRFYSTRFNVDYEATIFYKSGVLYQDISLSSRRVYSTATSPTGQKAELSDGRPGSRLRISAPSGRTILDTIFSF